MKKKLALAAMTMLGGLFATPAFAQETAAPQPAGTPDDHSGFYAGGRHQSLFHRQRRRRERPSDHLRRPALARRFRGPARLAFNEYVAVEVEAGIGGAKSDFEGPGIEGEIDVSGPVSAHGVLTLPIGEGGGYILGKAGYTSVNVERELNGTDAPDLEIAGASSALAAASAMATGTSAASGASCRAMMRAPAYWASSRCAGSDQKQRG